MTNGSGWVKFIASCRVVASSSPPPSGDPTPSSHDRELTQAVRAAAATVGVRFLDHLIIGDAGPFSFKANGLL